MRVLFLLFIVVPIIEMVLLIKVGQWLGVVPTIALVLLTAMIGVHLLRQQGLSTLLRANEKIAAGGLPAEEMLEGLVLAIGGALLLTPGFFTDALGFCCLLPFTRRAMIRKLLQKGVFVASQSPGFYQAHYHSEHFRSGGDGDIIDAEFSRETASSTRPQQRLDRNE